VPLVSLLAAFAGAVCIAEGSVLAKLFSPGHPVLANAIGMSIGALVLGTLSLLAGETWTLPSEPRTWAAVLYLASVGSVALFLAFLFVLRRWTASATSYVLLLMPLWTVTAAALVLGEAVSGTFMVGAVLVLAGTYVGAFLKPRPRNAPVCQSAEALPAAVAQR
jgi:drug/metabolite transporter (DMT)-like permease